MTFLEAGHILSDLFFPCSKVVTGRSPFQIRRMPYYCIVLYLTSRWRHLRKARRKAHPPPPPPPSPPPQTPDCQVVSAWYLRRRSPSPSTPSPAPNPPPSPVRPLSSLYLSVLFILSFFLFEIFKNWIDRIQNRSRYRRGGSGGPDRCSSKGWRS